MPRGLKRATVPAEKMTVAVFTATPKVAEKTRLPGKGNGEIIEPAWHEPACGYLRAYPDANAGVFHIFSGRFSVRRE